MNAIAALWFGVLTSLIVWLLDDTLQEKKKEKEKILSDCFLSLFYHKQAQREAMIALRHRWEGSAE